MNLSESGLEQSFWHSFFKCIGPFSFYSPQYVINPYRLDGIVVTQSRRIGIELDGKAFHNKQRDWERDKYILQTGQLDEIIRIPYAAMTYFRDGVFRILSHWHIEFAFRSFDMMVMSWGDFCNEMQVSRADAYFDERQFRRDIEPLYEIFDVEETYGWVCSPNTAANRLSDHSNLQYIQRRLAI
jgi:very-short-patch-repair endonuclease